MHLIRRAALRAASSSSSIVPRSRAINTASPFLLSSRAIKNQSSTSSIVFRRFNSNEAAPKTTEIENGVESADNEDGAVKAAIDSAAETTSESTSSPAYNGGEEAAPREYRPREPREDRFGSGDRGSRFDDRPAPPPTNAIYVGNLLFDITAKDLEREFGEFGTITSTTVAADVRGLSKGFGYVEFENQQQATAAIEAKHQSLLEGRRLVVNYMNKQHRTPRQPETPTKTLFIGNLAFEMSDADLNKLFRDVRNVIDVRVAIDRRTGQPRGFAHADFVDVESAIKGKELLTDKEVYGRKLRIDFSSGSRNSTGSGRSGGDRGDRRGGGGYNRGGDRGDRGDRGGSSF